MPQFRQKHHRLFCCIDALCCIVDIPEILSEKGRDKKFQCLLFGEEMEPVQILGEDAAILQF